MNLAPRGSVHAGGMADLELGWGGGRRMRNAKRLERARTMRHEATPAAVALWRRLSGSRLGGCKFRRQHVIGAAIVDFLCPAKGVIVEEDGDTHDAEAGRDRDAEMWARGFRTVRFTNREVGETSEECLERLLAVLQNEADRWPDCPTPAPLLKGRGYE